MLDTHILIRWLAEPQKLSRNQLRVIEQAVKRSEPLAISDMTLLEIAVLLGEGSHRINSSIEDLFTDLQDNPFFRVLPLTYEIAVEVAAVGPSLRDPADRAIVATARVHRLRLVTSDQRIVESKLVSVVE